MDSLSLLIGFTVFKVDGFFTDEALGTPPLAWGCLFGSNVGRLIPPGRGTIPTLAAPQIRV